MASHPAPRGMTRTRQKLSEERAESWTKADFFHDLTKATRRITDEINSDPKETQALRESRQQAKEGDLHWGDLEADSGTD